MKRILGFAVLAASFLLDFSCSMEDSVLGGGETSVGAHVEDDAAAVEEDAAVEAKWTVVVYMAADNNLESAAIKDLNELERADIPDSFNVLALLDRSAGYDASNGNWSDTRLFRIRRDAENSGTIASERLSCEALGLSADSETELDMADRSTLSGVLSFAREKFPAENYALVVWGHGAGWRGDPGCPEPRSSGAFRAFAADEGGSAVSVMENAQFRKAVEDGMGGRRLDFLAFDTCFGSCIESAYEFSGCARIMAGTPSIEPDDGWDYAELFRILSDSGDFSPVSLGNAALAQFRNQYAGYKAAAFCLLDLDNCRDAVEAFDSFCAEASALVSTSGDRDEFAKVIENGCRSYRNASFPTDFYADVRSMVESFSEVRPSLSESARKCLSALDSLVVDSWTPEGGRCSPGVFYASFESAQKISSKHPESYYLDSVDPNSPRFVRDCGSYVPTLKKSGSLLDKLFYDTLVE